MSLLYRKIITVHTENYNKHIYTVWVKTYRYSSVKLAVTHVEYFWHPDGHPRIAALLTKAIK
jgi:hypothetical protein